MRALIHKIPYDENIKALFVKKLDTGLYETHKEFLRNPLLTLMMLITLEQFAEIPAKIHLFYEHAFEALFRWHDVTKSGGFQRKRHVSIALDDYRRLFSYFCTISYMKEAFRFTLFNALVCSPMMDSTMFSITGHSKSTSWHIFCTNKSRRI